MSKDIVYKDCEHCNGTGKLEKGLNAFIDCPKCFGTGQVKFGEIKKEN